MSIILFDWGRNKTILLYDCRHISQFPQLCLSKIKLYAKMRYILCNCWLLKLFCPCMNLCTFCIFPTCHINLSSILIPFLLFLSSFLFCIFIAIQQEKSQHDLINGIEHFNRTSLKHAETQEKNPLPTKEVIDQEKAA